MECCHCAFWLSICMLVVSPTLAGADEVCEVCNETQSDSDAKILLQVSNGVKAGKYPKLQHESMHRNLFQNPFGEVHVERMSRSEIEAAVQRMQAPWEQVIKKYETVDLLQKGTQDGQPHTEVECKGPKYNVTCKFQNLYFDPSTGFIAYFPQGFKPPEEMQSLLPIHRYGGTDPPTVSSAPLPSVNNVVPGTTVYYHTIWHQNIGHFLWDGLYPAYVALTQWGLEGKDFNSVAVFEENCYQAGAPNGRCLSEDIMRKIGGETGKFFVKGQMKDALRFEEFVMGSGHKGARTLNRDFSMWGQRDLDALRSFRDRMYRVYRLNPPPRRRTSLEHRESKLLRAIIIDNKRYSFEEQSNLKTAAKEIPAETANLQVEYINYGDTAHDFGKQLKLLQNADIHVSGPGTGMSYLDFMPDGSVHVALGTEGAWPWNDRKRPYEKLDVSFVEEYWAEGNTHLRALVYPIKEHREQGGLTKPLIKSVLGDAAALIRSDYKMPVEPGVNLSPVGQTFKEYCYTVGHQECDILLAKMNGDVAAAECDAWPDGIVWEAGGYSEQGFEGTHCEINRKLLRDIRKKHLDI